MSKHCKSAITTGLHREMKCKENQKYPTEDKKHGCLNLPSLLLWNKKWMNTHFYACQTCIQDKRRAWHPQKSFNSRLTPKSDRLLIHPTAAATAVYRHILLAIPTCTSERDLLQTVQDRRQLT